MKNLLVIVLILAVFILTADIAEAAYFFAGKKHIPRTTPMQSFKTRRPSYSYGSPVVSFNPSTESRGGSGGGGGSVSDSESSAGPEFVASLNEGMGEPGSAGTIVNSNRSRNPRPTVSLGGLWGDHMDLGDTVVTIPFPPGTTVEEEEDDEDGSEDDLLALEDWEEILDNPTGEEDYPDAVPNPEPATIILFLSGLFGVGLWRKKRH